MPRTDRDVMMVRLMEPANGVTPVPVATAAPTTGEDLQVLGFGRTGTDWLPAQSHNATLTTGAVASPSVELTAKTAADTVCKGDAGAPAVRAGKGGFELAAVISRAWQGGCLGESETCQGAPGTRVDDIAGWIADTRDHRSATANEAGGSGRVRWADFDGDGKADYWLIKPDGSVTVFLNRGGDVVGAGGWYGLGQVATGVTSDRSRVRLADFDGDGKADYWVINPDGSVHVWLNRGGDGHGGWQPIGRVAAGVTTDHTSVQLVDFTGDTRADYLRTDPEGHVSAYANNGGDPSGQDGWTSLGQIVGGA